jgi:hypothetical protein
LLAHQIDVREMTDESLRTLIASHREYFQLMLGPDEPSDRQIFRLLRRWVGQPAQLRRKSNALAN